MSITIKKDLQIPVVIQHTKTMCEVYIPDFSMTVHGTDYVDASADATMKASAVYYYNLERNLRLELKTTYTEAEAMCKAKGSFATFICLTTQEVTL